MMKPEVAHDVPGGPEIAKWTRLLEESAARELDLCPEFPTIARRFEAWWNQTALDRPIFIASANANPARPLTRRLELLDSPDAWFAAKKEDLRQTFRVGDALPHIRIDFGAAMLGSLLGGTAEIGNDTTWTHAFLNDAWSNAPDWTIRRDHPWWSLLDRHMARVSEDARGHYLVCTPNMGGPMDILLNFRGPAELCMDAIDQPETISGAAEAMQQAHAESEYKLYEGIVERGAGLLHWLQLWSNEPYIIAECDFSYMLGEQQFREVCMPDIARQSTLFSRAIFHLDGPGSARHIDQLLEIPSIQAIQYTPGEGTPSALPWIPMFRKIQKSGRSVLICTPPEEVLELCDALAPEGLAFFFSRTPAVADLQALWESFERKFRL